MSLAVQVLGYALSASLVVLSAVLLRDAIRERTEERAYVALAVALLAGTALLWGGPLSELIGYTQRWIDVVNAEMFLLSGYVLLLFRRAVSRPSRTVFRAATAGVVFSAVLCVVVPLPRAPDAVYSPAELWVVTLLTLFWGGCIVEPSIHFWRMARTKAVVQGARLRALALGYGGILLLSVASLPAAFAGTTNTSVLLTMTVAVQLLALPLIGFLYVSFAPPRWLRRAWREREERALMTESPPLFLVPERQILAGRAIDWSTRLVGADQGFIADPGGRVLAVRSMDPARATALAAEVGTPDPPRIVRPHDVGGAAAIVSPLPQEAGVGMLVVVAGHFTPRLAAEEVNRVSYYAGAIAVALDRARIEEMKETFLTAISHELRTPLTSVLGLAETLMHHEANGLPAERRQELLKRLSNNANRLDRILVDLLDLDRLTRGVLRPHRRLVDVTALVDKVIAETEILRDRTIHVDVRPILTGIDPALVERILENLLVNAVKHTPMGTQVWLRISRVHVGVMIAVEDDGPGVPLDLRQAVFEPFRRGPDAPKHSPGTGAGLALVARFAELHGGRAWVEERLGGGASFRVVLPGAQPLEPAASVVPQKFLDMT
jgi:signal transduction histidine kinase